MPRGRPHKSTALHLIQGTYRRDRHGPLPQAVNRASCSIGEKEAQPERVSFDALPADVQAWELLEFGDDFFYELPSGISEARARRLARARWREHGPELMHFWGPERRRASWAYKRFGEP